MKPGDQYWALVEPHWERVDIDTPEAFLASFANTPPLARDLLAAHWCVSEVCNGGFHQFFFNSTGVLAPEAATGFASIGLVQLSSLVRAAMLFFGEAFPRDRETRIATLEAHECESPDSAGPFAELDDQFYDLIATEGGGWEEAADRFARPRLKAT
jgi:hypothetical protein